MTISRILALVVILGLQGCISIPTGKLNSATRMQATSSSASESADKVYVSFNYDSNRILGDENKTEVLASDFYAVIKEHFIASGIEVVDVTSWDEKPDRYTSYDLIIDFAHDARAEDRGPLQLLTGVAFVFSFGIVPYVGNNTDSYLVEKVFEKGVVVSDVVHTKSSTLVMGTLLLPLSPFLTQKSGNERVLESIFTEKAGGLK